MQEAKVFRSKRHTPEMLRRSDRWPIVVACIFASSLGLGCVPASKQKNEQLTPDRLARLRYRMADQLVAKRDYERALPYLRPLIRAHPDDLRLRLLLGIVLREKGMHRVAKKELGAVVKKAPKSAPAQAAFAVLLDKMGRHKKAEPHHRLAVNLSPKDSRYHNDLGFCLFLQRKYDQAQESLEQAILLDPGMRLAYNNLGYLHGVRGDDDKAMSAFRQAGSKAMALTNMGLVAEMRGQPGRARLYYERALRARPNYRPAKRNLRSLQPQLRKPEAAKKPWPTQPGAPAPRQLGPERGQEGEDGTGEARDTTPRIRRTDDTPAGEER